GAAPRNRPAARAGGVRNPQAGPVASEAEASSHPRQADASAAPVAGWASPPDGRPHADRNLGRGEHASRDPRRSGHLRGPRGVPRTLSADGAPAPAADDGAPGGRRHDIRGVGARMNAEVRFDFEGKVAIVTGAARGVGRALVGELAPDAASYSSGAVIS